MRGASTPNMKIPCTSSNAKSRACKAGSILEELYKQLTEERDQFLERYYRLISNSSLWAVRSIARAGITDGIGYLRGRPEKHDQHEIPALPAVKSLDNGSGLEAGIAKIAALDGEHRSAE
jgi:hypothetical protein